tara:strand:- start:201 stop:623 length:423 start_codon:yes stop_codon:yes gene_type:complete
MLIYEGKTAGEIAKALSTTRPKIIEHLESTKVQSMIDEAQEKRHALVAHIPIANFATRLSRLEQIYKVNESMEDYAMCLKTLTAAREETKLVRVETSENSKPQFVVNITSFKGDESPVEAVEVAEAVERTTRHLPSSPES